MTLAEDLVATAMVWAVTGMISIPLLYGGLYFYRSGKRSYSQSKRVAETTPIPISEVSPRLDEIAVEGTVRPVESEGTIDAPFSDADAVVAHSTVSEKRRTRRAGSSGTRTARRTIHSKNESVPFLLEDDTGVVRVEPHEDAYFQIERETLNESTAAYSKTLGSGESFAPDERPEALQEWIDQSSDVSRTLDDKARGRTYVQQLVEVGETAFVMGNPREASGNQGEEALEIVPGDDPEQMIVSDMSGDEIESKGTWGAAGAGTIAVILFALGALPGLAFLFMTLFLLAELASLL